MELIIIVIAVVLVTFTNAQKIKGQSIIHDYYGGKITSVTYCTCYYDFGVVLQIQDKSRNNQTVKVFYSPFLSRLRANYSIWTAGPNVIGGYTIGYRPCRMTAGYYCSNSNTTADGTIDFIRGIGTSLIR